MLKIRKIVLFLLINLLMINNFSNSFIFAEDNNNNENSNKTGIVIEENEIEESDNGEKDEESAGFFDKVLIDNIEINVSADKGVFPQNSAVSVEKVENDTINENVVLSYAYDIKVLDENGEEIQPNGKVNISFTIPEIADDNLETKIYHEEEELPVITEGNTATVETEGFSVYTVEFTYNNKQYVLEGDTYVRLDDILATVELSGNVEGYEVSNSELFNIYKGNEDGVEYVENYDDSGDLVEYYPINKEDGNTLYMVALQPFTSQEWLKVTIDGIEYTIVVTDAIRVDENGDQAGTNVRFMQTYGTSDNSTRYVSITDNRVIQGPLEDNFTASMPLAEIYIDDTIVNQTLWGRDEYNGTRVIAELLVDNTQGKYAGFQINMNTNTTSTDKGSLQNSYGGVWYDFTKRYLNDIQNLVVSGSSANNYELFSGDIVRYTLKGMATKFDVASNAYKNYDVVITYSDILITLCQDSGTGAVDQTNISSILKLIDTNMVNFTWSGGFRAGLSYNVNVKVVDPDTGDLIDGSYYYPMTDIDIGRTGIGGFANLYNASNLNRYSEQVALMSNYGRPTSSGSWEQMVWIPGGNYSAAPFTNKANVTENNYPYTCNITSKTIDGKANTLLISPGGTTTAVSGKITTASGVNKDNTFYSGFITLANNTAGGINVKGYASAPKSGGVESYVLTGSQIVNHKVDASSDVGGTIFTTTTGNSDGSLSGGTLLGYNEVNKPFEISAATGQSVTYTMTPKGGYKLKRIWVKNGDIDIMTIVNTAKVTVNKNDYDTNSDGELDENERHAYEATVETAINTALANDSDTSAISVSSLTSLGKGVYAYTFAGIQEDKSIHIDWEKTDLTVTKKLSPTMSGITDKFKFQIKLSDTSTEETTWRVRAKKNTGKISYRNPYFTDYVNTTYYFGYWEGHEETLPYSYVEVTETEDKNPYEEGWYIYYNGSYMPSYDTTVDESATYYEKDDTQTSTVTNYYYHLLGWNESTNSWEEKVVPATSGMSDGAVLGLENLDTELPDYHRYNYDGTVVNNENYYNEETGTYDKYLMWIPDATTGKQTLVVGNTEEHPNGTAFSMSDYYTYIYEEGIANYSGKVFKENGITIDGKSFNSNFGGTGYWYTQDDTMPIYYNLINNSNGYNTDSGYTPLEGESGMYIITLPAGQTPNTDDLTADGWDVTVSRVGAIEDDFDLDQAMTNAGAKSVAGAVNTYEFELGVDESIDFNGVIPMGWNYEITEILDQNSRWEKVSNTPNAVVNDFDGEEHVTFTNTEKKYDITVKKQTVDNIAGTFNFKIKAWRGETGSEIYIDLSSQLGQADSNGYYSFTLSNSQSKIITNLPHGAKYEIYEETKEGWKLIDIDGANSTVDKGAGGTSGTLNADAEHTFNNIPLYDLKVSKTVTGLKGDKNKEFEFEVKVWKETQDNTQYEYVDFIDVYGGDGDQNPDWNLLSNVAFTYQGKTFEADKEYTMYRVYGGGSWYGFNNEYRGTADSARPDLEYENRIEGPYDDALISFFDSLIATPFVEMDYMPPYDTGEKVIIQGEEYPLFAAGYNSQGSEHAYSVYYGKPSVQKTYIDLSSQGGIDNGDGSYTFKLKHSESFAIEDIPYGYTYEIIEKDYSSDMYTTTVDGANTREVTGTVDGNKTHNYINDKDFADLTITKMVTGNMGNKSKDFRFTIKVSNIDLSQYGGIDNENGSYTFTLKHGESISLSNLPAGCEYEIKELDYSSEGYITSVDGKKSRTITGVLDDNITHLFENKNQVAVPTEIRVNSWLFGVSLIMIALIILIKIKYRRV